MKRTVRSLIVENSIKAITEQRNYSKETLERVLNENLKFDVKIGDVKEFHGYVTSHIYYADEDSTTKCITLTVKQ